MDMCKKAQNLFNELERKNVSFNEITAKYNVVKGNIPISNFEAVADDDAGNLLQHAVIAGKYPQKPQPAHYNSTESLFVPQGHYNVSSNENYNHIRQGQPPVMATPSQQRQPYGGLQQSHIQHAQFHRATENVIQRPTPSKLPLHDRGANGINMGSHNMSGSMKIGKSGSINGRNSRNTHVGNFGPSILHG